MQADEANEALLAMTRKIVSHLWNRYPRKVLMKMTTRVRVTSYRYWAKVKLAMRTRNLEVVLAGGQDLRAK